MLIPTAWPNKEPYRPLTRSFKDKVFILIDRSWSQSQKRFPPIAFNSLGVFFDTADCRSEMKKEKLNYNAVDRIFQYFMICTISGYDVIIKMAEKRVFHHWDFFLRHKKDTIEKVCAKFELDITFSNSVLFWLARPDYVAVSSMDPTSNWL